MYKNKPLLLVFASLIFFQFANSQNNTNSPYTRFGYGDISDTNNGEQRAMGGVAIGSRSNASINTINPASYSSVDSMTFMFDLGSAALLSHFKNDNGSTNKFNANLEYITMQFPLSKHIGFSAGLLPYSFLGYDFYSSDTLLMKSTGVPDTIPLTRSFSGSGGFSQVYMGISAKLFNHISLGVNAYYMYGTINNYRDLSFSSTSYASTTQVNAIKANNFRYRFGAQFFNTFNKIHDVTLGVIYEPKKALNGSFAQTTYSTGDTISSNVNGFDLPETYGVGFNYCYNKRLSIGVDYSMQAWKNARFFGKTDSLNNRSKLAVGLEYQPNPMGRNYSDRIRYRAGFNISDSYYKVVGITPPKNYSITCGIGLPLFNKDTKAISMLNASIEYGKLGGVSSLREDYFKFNLNIVFNEHWFFKRKL